MEYTELAVLPQLCLKQDESLLSELDSNNYICEHKYDGTRVLVHIGDHIKIFTRNGKSELSSHYPDLIDELNHQVLPIGTILDGELVFFKENGEIEFQSALITRETAIERKLTPAIIFFDIIYFGKSNISNKTLIERKEILKNNIIQTKKIVLSPYYENDFKYIFENEVSNGREGVVIKLKSSTYTPNARNKDWMKFKRHDTIDCVVLGITEGTGKYQNTFGALILGIVTENTIKICGYCSGMTDQERKMLYDTIMKMDEYTYNKKFSKKILRTVYPSIIVETEYMEITEYNMLRHPRFVRVRYDKSIDIPKTALPKRTEKITSLTDFF